jgi:hypothetical protein
MRILFELPSYDNITNNAYLHAVLEMEEKRKYASLCVFWDYATGPCIV